MIFTIVKDRKTDESIRVDVFMIGNFANEDNLWFD